MQAVIMAGGRGTRMRRSGSPPPKALTPLAGQPLLTHVCRHLHAHGVTRIVVALGHRADEIAAAMNRVREHLPGVELAWIDTGTDCGNGGRLLRLGSHAPDRTFVMCWCDAVTDLDLTAMRDFHARHGRAATIAAVPEPPRWGQLDMDGDRVLEMREKHAADRRWINGGYCVLEPAVIDLVGDAGESWERGALQRLIAADDLRAWRHAGFWSAIDTLSDRDAAEAALTMTPRPEPA